MKKYSLAAAVLAAVFSITMPAYAEQGISEKTIEWVAKPDFSDIENMGDGYFKLDIVNDDSTTYIYDCKNEKLKKFDYKYMTYLGEGLFEVPGIQKIKVVNFEGKEVVGELYDSIEPFSEGLAAVTSYKKIGYIDKTGTLVIPCTLYEAGSFSDGMAVYETTNHMYGYINMKGEKVIRAKYRQAQRFREGLAAVYEEGTLGYIDKNGNTVFKTNSRNGGNFNNGTAFVSSDNGVCVMDKEGNVLKTIALESQPFFAENLEDINGFGFMTEIIVEDENSTQCSGHRHVSNYYDDKGEPTDIYNYRAGLAGETQAVIYSENKKFGYMDENGNKITEAIFDEARGFKDNYAAVKVNGKFGIISLKVS